ncbi:CHAT domain-containing protein [Aspergillus crustosus]
MEILPLAAHLGHEGRALLNEYQHTGDIDILDASINAARQALQYALPHERFLYLNDLGYRLRERFEACREIDDISEAISLVGQSAEAIGDSDLRAKVLNNLATFLSDRFELKQDEDDLERGILAARHALGLSSLNVGFQAEYRNTLSPLWLSIWALEGTEQGDENLPMFMGNLGVCYERRYERLGYLVDINAAVDYARNTVSMTAPDNPAGGVRNPAQRSVCLKNLSNALGRRYELTNELQDLKDAIEHGIDAANLIPGHPRWPEQVHNVSLLLEDRFMHLGDVADLDDAIEQETGAASAIDSDDPRILTFWDQFSESQYAMYLKSGLQEHFQMATRLAQQAMETDVPQGLDQPLRLCTISSRFKERYSMTQSESDIQHSIDLAERAVSLRPANHPQSPHCLWTLSLALETRYLGQGSLSDLERAIQVNQEVLAADSLGRLDRNDILYSLSVQITHRYEHLGALVDLEEAIHLMRENRQNMPEDNLFGRVVCLKTLSDQLGYLFERNNEVPVLTEAIAVANEALELHRRSDIARVGILNSLALLLRSRFNNTGLIHDLDAAHDLHRQALSLVPEDDPERHLVMYNMVTSLFDLFRHKEEQHPDNHPNRAMYLNALGLLLQEPLNNTSCTPPPDIRHSTIIFTKGLQNENSPPLDRIKAGQNAFHAQIALEDWASVCALARDVVKLFPLLVPRWLDRTDRQHLLKNISHFTSLAASAALQMGEPPTSALDLLEAGRGVISGLTIDMKTDIAGLEAVEPTLHMEYTQLRQRVLLPKRSNLVVSLSSLQSGGAGNWRRRPGSYVPPITTTGNRRAEDLRILKALEDRIRLVPGYEHFLERLSEHDYMSLAAPGPIVSFNVTKYRSDAIIITSTKIISIRLEKLQLSDLKRYVPKVTGENQLSKGLASTKKQRNQELQDILRWLWDTAVFPVLRALDFHHSHPLEVKSLPRIWWLASGYMGLLPMHAANDGNGTATMDYAISSYTPTLAALRFSRDQVSRRPRELNPNPNLLFVLAPEKPGHHDLNSEAELQSIKDGLDTRCNISYTLLDRPSKLDVLSELPTSHIIHFSCHGVSNPTDPSASGLLLPAADGAGSIPTVHDLAAVSHARAQLAFLSACSTAESSSDDLLDETIHIASAFQLVGFPHVVASLWEISDRDAVAICGLFYKELGWRLAAGGGLLEGVISDALHWALQRVRRSKRVVKTGGVLSWAPFIHMGA